MNHINKYILSGILLLSHFPLLAHIEEGNVNHLIISIDTKPAQSYRYRNDVPYELIRFINSYGLIKENDYISVLQYSVPSNDPNLDKYVRIPTSDGVQKHVFDRIGKNNTLENILSMNNWCRYVKSNYDAVGYSLSSIAKPYSVAALKSDSVLVNRTFIALVTDHRYNAQDFYQELDAWRTDNNHSSMSFNDIMKKCYDVDKEYFMSYINTRVITPSCFIDLYEIIPLRRDVSFSSVFFYPPTVKAVRIKGKGYLISLPVKNTVQDKFKPLRIDIASILSDGKKNDSKTFTNQDEFEYVTFSSNKGEIKQLRVSAWLNIKDGFYNATLLTPDENCSPKLNETIMIEYPEVARVMGIPLSDTFWFFYPNDQYKAALVIKGIVILLILLIIALCLKKLGHYNPSDNKIHLQ